MPKNLVEIIKSNPRCVATIDNDCWQLETENGKVLLATSEDEIEPIGDGGYGSGSCYGGDILQALALIVGIKVESV